MVLAILIVAPLASLALAVICGRWVYRGEVPHSMVAFAVGVGVFNGMLSIFTKILDYMGN